MLSDDREQLREEIAEALGARSCRLPADFFDEMDYWRELADAVLAMQTASCHVFECRNDRTADSPYCPAHTQITELLAAAPFPPVDREALAKVLSDCDDKHGGPLYPSYLDYADALISAGVVAQPPAWWKDQEVEWNSTGDTWKPGVIIAPLAPVVALIKLHDNGQRLNVETRHLRARDSSREAGQP